MRKPGFLPVSFMEITSNGLTLSVKLKMESLLEIIFGKVSRILNLARQSWMFLRRKSSSGLGRHGSGSLRLLVMSINSQEAWREETCLVPLCVHSRTLAYGIASPTFRVVLSPQLTSWKCVHRCSYKCVPYVILKPVKLPVAMSYPSSLVVRSLVKLLVWHVESSHHDFGIRARGRKTLPESSDVGHQT